MAGPTETKDRPTPTRFPILMIPRLPPLPFCCCCYCRLMAIRCGTYSTVPSMADLAPGAKTLYTTDGQAVTVVAAHADSGEAFFLLLLA